MKDYRFTKSRKEAPRIKGKIVESELSRRAKRYLLASRKRHKEKREKVKAVWVLDSKIWLHKYYPWCYNEYLPTLVLQGWYNEDKAKKAYLRIYGPEALKYVKFIKGKDAVEREFKIGHNLYINGRWRYIPGKSSMLPSKYGECKSQVTKLIPGRNTNAKRKNLDTEIPYYQNGSQEIIFENKSIKKARLQKVSSLKNERKKELYIEE